MNLDRNAQLEIQYQADPVCKEIFDTLLLAGYFRIRLPAIKVFDKLLGGLAWCISCSNFNIDLPYHDDMPLRQKLKLSEIVVSALQSMKCPYILSPHQIQGANFPSLLPVFKWLIKFVLETRDYRQDFNKNMCQFINSKIYKPAAVGPSKVSILFTEKDHRLRKNTQISKQQLRDPLRVYSSLIEFDDRTAYKTYTKLLALVAGKKRRNKNKQPTQKNQIKEEDIIQQRRRISTPTSGTLSKGKTVGQLPTELIEKIEKQYLKEQEQEQLEQQSQQEATSSIVVESHQEQEQSEKQLFSSQAPKQSTRSTLLTNEKGYIDSHQQDQNEKKIGDHHQETDVVEYFEQEGYYNVFFEEEEEFETREERPKQSREVQEDNLNQIQHETQLIQGQSQGSGYEEYNEETVQQIREQKEVSNRGHFDDFNEQEEFKSFQPLQKRTSIVGKEFLQLLAENEVLAEHIKELEEQAKKLAELQQSEIAIQLQKKNELKNQEEEITRIDKQIEKMENNITEEAKKMEETLKREEGFAKETESFERKFEDLDNTLDQLKKQIEEEKIKDLVKFEKVDQMIVQREALRNKKLSIKLEAKKKMEEFEKEKQEIEAQMPQFDDNVIKAIDAELVEKKKKYDIKYKEFANLNKEISIVQRKIENYPSAIETAQYHQRSIELFENIHKEMEKYRDIYINYNNLTDVKIILDSYSNIFNSFKTNYFPSIKNKNSKMNFLKNLTETKTGLEQNYKKAGDVLQKTKAKKDELNNLNNQMNQTERDYFKCLKELQLEYEKHEYLQKGQN